MKENVSHIFSIPCIPSYDIFIAVLIRRPRSQESSPAGRRARNYFCNGYPGIGTNIFRPEVWFMHLALFRGDRPPRRACLV